MAIENLTPDLKKSVYDFLVTYASPAIDPNYVFNGNQNNFSLPADSNDYIIFTFLNNQRHGTTVEDYEKEATSETVKLWETVQTTVQIDCYSSNESGNDGTAAMIRAQSYETIARSTVGCDFFKKNNIGCLYADNARDATLVGDSDTYVRRWMLTLNLSYRSTLNLPQSFFTSVDLGVHNVDVKFKP